jgi:hypothetical protein
LPDLVHRRGRCDHPDPQGIRLGVVQGRREERHEREADHEPDAEGGHQALAECGMREEGGHLKSLVDVNVIDINVDDIILPVPEDLV